MHFESVLHPFDKTTADRDQGLNKRVSHKSNAQADGLYLRQGPEDGLQGPSAFYCQGLRTMGYVQNLDDGRVKVVAEGEDYDLESLLAAIYSQNKLIQVADIQKEYSAATDELQGFFKAVTDIAETDPRLDEAKESPKAAHC